MGKKYGGVDSETVTQSERKVTLSERMGKDFSGDSCALERIQETEPDSMEMREEFSVRYNQTCSL